MAFGTTPSEGVEYALWNTTLRKVKNAFWGARGRLFTVKTPAITLAAGGQIKMVRLSVGTVVHGGRVTWSATGASNVMVLGDDGDCDRYKLGFRTNIGSIEQGVAGGDCEPFNNVAGRGYEITSSTQDVILTNSYAAATSAMAEGLIKVTMEVSNE